MKIDKKKIPYIIGAGVIGVLGYFAYKKYKEGQNLPTPTPEPTPTPTPTPTKPKPTAPTKASAAKIDELQKLMIRRFIQLNRENEYTANDAKGGWGDKSRNALKFLKPTTYASKGDPNASNIDFWIDSTNKDVEAAAAQMQQQKTKQTTQDANKKLSKGIVDYLAQGGKAKVISEFKAVKHQFDAVKKTYVPLDETRTFRKGLTYSDGELVDRQNGQIMVKSGEFRYPTNPQNFLTYND